MNACREHFGHCPPPPELARRACQRQISSPPVSFVPSLGNVAELYTNWLNKDRTQIPKILHQTWRDCNVPVYQAGWRAHCDTTLRLDWAFWLWDDVANRELIRSSFGSHLPLYDSYEVGIKRADVIRLFILYKHGGVYMDLDFLCLRPFESLPYLPDGMAVFGWQDHNNHIAANAFMAAPPGHPFIAFLISQLIHGDRRQVFTSTGPYFLTQALGVWQKRHGWLSNSSGVVVHPFPHIYNHDPKNQVRPCGRQVPDMRINGSRDYVERCAARFNTSFVTTFWTKTWLREVATSIVHGNTSMQHGSKFGRVVKASKYCDRRFDLC